MPTVPNQPRAIYLWVSNTPRSSYFSLSVESHTFFRLNYPLRLNRWYHSCTSWNGRTGEWQIWVNAERVGRGFHNRVGIHISENSQTLTSGSRLQIRLGPVTVTLRSVLIKQQTKTMRMNDRTKLRKTAIKDERIRQFKKDKKVIEYLEWVKNSPHKYWYQQT
jgi:hypothetical protein